MSDPVDQDRLDLLAKRIEEAEARASGATKPDVSAPSREDMQGSHLWIDMAATMIASMLIGWVFDRAFGTQPWGFIAMIPGGFAIVMVNIWRALAQQDKDQEKDK